MSANTIAGTSDRRRTPWEWALLSFALLGGPLAWFFHSATIVLLVPAACESGGSWPHWLSTGGSVGVSLASLAVSYSIWQRSRQRGEGIGSEEQSNTGDGQQVGFLSWGGLFTGSMFLLLILIETLPLVVLGACEVHP